MRFSIIKRFGQYPPNEKNCVFLTWDDWNDYSYYTSFGIFYVDNNSNRNDLEGVKIGFIGQNKVDRVFSVGKSFTYVGDGYFSMGSSDEYYRRLNELGDDIRDEILIGLNDIAKDEKLFERAIQEDVTKVSFFRNISPTTVTGQYRRMANGGARLTAFSFNFSIPLHESASHSSIDLTFDVQPESFPPTNIHVLIGRNGVGKTYIINHMINSILNGDLKKSTDINIDWLAESHNQDQLFANLISVSFSAFDETKPRTESIDPINNLRYTYIGLKQLNSGQSEVFSPKDTVMLTREFQLSLKACKAVSLVNKWRRSIKMLESDPNFKEADISKLIEIEDETNFSEETADIFRRLSSGHKIVLLTITRLIESLQERTLVLLDEPEGHLHPPLLSAFIRTLSELLIKSNGVSIIATHSPVILQEVPRSCVWKLRRSGAEMVADRLSIESFGENVGVLTNEIFGLEVTNSGFYNILNEIVISNSSYEEIVERFNGQLGMEAKAILRSLLISKKD